MLALTFALAGCNFSENKEPVEENIEVSENKTVGETEESSGEGENPSEDKAKEAKKGLVNQALEHEEGVPYELGVTPDDYHMDYDTSRLLSLEDKKSEFYPEDGVKGLYFNSYSVNDPATFDKIIGLIEDTRLNAVVIDIKDDWGNVTMNFETDDEDITYSKIDIIDPESFIEDMHDRGIYVIGRITTFKDSIITEKHPDWGFTLEDGSLWKNGAEEAFMNPFLNEVQDYDIKIAKLAAKAGFDEIQFDYVRFAEGFETFGYALQVGRADGIGQDFGEMSNQTDIMSSMIYPSHWGAWSFDIEKPDLEPYELVKRYLAAEQEYLSNIEHKPLSRPWIQDFTATWIGEGNWMEYDKEAVEAQIQAIYDSGQQEFLLWNASSDYTMDVEY